MSPDRSADLPADLPGDIADALSRMTHWREIGSGGFATVYVALDTVLDRDVAIKVLRTPLDAMGRRRFEREAQMVARFSNHPTVLPIYDSGVSEASRGWLVMELAKEGSLLRQVEEDGPLPPAQVSSVVRDLAAALDVAHAQGVVHCDVKPANVVRNDYGVAKLSDFGIAQLMLEDLRSTLDAGVGPRSPAYASPELLRAEEVSPATDEWMLAATACHLLTGTAPFHGEQVDSAEGAVDRTVAQVSGVGGSGRLREVLTKAFAERPADRYRSCGALAEAFAGAVAEDEDAMCTLNDERAATPRPRRPRRWPRVAGIVAMLALVAGFLVFRLATTESDVRPAEPNGPVWVAAEDAAVRLTGSSGSIEDRVRVATLPSSVIGAPWEYDGSGGAYSVEPPAVAVHLDPRYDEPVRVALTELEPGVAVGRVFPSLERDEAWFLVHPDDPSEIDQRNSRVVLVDFGARRVLLDVQLPGNANIGSAAILHDGSLVFDSYDEGANLSIFRVDRRGEVHKLTPDFDDVVEIRQAGSHVWLLPIGAGPVRTVDLVDDELRIGEPVELPGQEDLLSDTTSVGFSNGSVALGQVEPTRPPQGSGRIWVVEPSLHVRTFDLPAEQMPPADLDMGSFPMTVAAQGSNAFWVTARPRAVVQFDSVKGPQASVAVRGDTDEDPPELVPVPGGGIVLSGRSMDFIGDDGSTRALGTVTQTRFDLRADSRAGPRATSVVAIDVDQGRWTAVSGNGNGNEVSLGSIDARCIEASVRNEVLWCLDDEQRVQRITLGDSSEPAAVIDEPLSTIGVGPRVVVGVDADDPALLHLVPSTGVEVAETITLDASALNPLGLYWVIGSDVYWPALGDDVAEGSALGFNHYHADSGEVRTEPGAPVRTFVAGDDGSVWGSTASGIVQIDPSTDQVLATYEVPRATGSLVAIVRDLGTAIAWANDDGQMAFFDREDLDSPVVVEVGAAIDGLASLDGDLWVATGSVVHRYSADGTEVATIEVPGVHRVQAAGGFVWAVNGSDATLVRIDPATNTIVQTIDLNA